MEELLQPMKAALQQCPGKIIQIWISTSHDDIMTVLPSDYSLNRTAIQLIQIPQLVVLSKGQVPNIQLGGLKQCG